MTWAEQFAALAALDEADDGRWEVEHERLRDAWLTAYAAAFVAVAVSRGWKPEDAATWPAEIADDAYNEAYRHDWDPQRTAAADVIGCEQERC
jgi:hypothetical protein